MKYITILLTFLLCSCAAMSLDRAVAEDEYQCAAELYPEAAKAGNFLKLGESMVFEGITYKVIAEAKSPEKELWIQFIDTDQVKPLDGNCDFAMQLILQDGKMYVGQSFHCAEIMMQLSQYCAAKGLELDKFIHKPKVKKNKYGVEI